MSNTTVLSLLFISLVIIGSRVLQPVPYGLYLIIISLAAIAIVLRMDND
jgi:hypothetical protein